MRIFLFVFGVGSLLSSIICLWVGEFEKGIFFVASSIAYLYLLDLSIKHNNFKNLE